MMQILEFLHEFLVWLPLNTCISKQKRVEYGITPEHDQTFSHNYLIHVCVNMHSAIVFLLQNCVGVSPV